MRPPGGSAPRRRETAPGFGIIGGMTTTPCPCGSRLPTDRCCGRWWQADAPSPPDAATLMRSRYSAFVLQRADHLLATWHASTRPETVAFEPGLHWLGLELRHASLQDDDHATVEFVARSKIGGRAHRLHETSRFVREGGRWFYLDGELHPPAGWR